MSQPPAPRKRRTPAAAGKSAASAPKSASRSANKSTSKRASRSAGPAKKATPAQKAAAAKKSAPSTPSSTPAETTVPGPAELGASSRAARKRPSRKQIRDAAEASVKREPTLRAVPDLPETSEPAGAQQSSPLSAAGIEQGVSALVGLLRAAGRAAGLDGDDLEQRVARTLSYLRRRVTGDYTVDDFGFDRDFTEEVWLPLLRPIYQHWFRVEVRGIENLPTDGSALIVANHSGTVPIDGLMLQVAVFNETGRHARMLGADLVFSSPFIGELARKAGSTLAANPDVERLLETGELTAVFPEGFKGVGKGFSERYRLQRFGRGGFVSAALQSGAPIVPCAIVGAEETYPMLANIKSLARVLGFPYFPITPFFPLLGPLGAIPLPSKWIIEFGAPIETAPFGPDATEDPMLVFDLTDQVRETIQQTLYSLLLRRRSAFF